MIIDNGENMEEHVGMPMVESQVVTIEDVERMIAEQHPAFIPADPFPDDETATWRYWTTFDTADHGVPDEWVWERLRIRRDQLLAACDWRVVNDAPWDIAPWIAYRQALRDLPDNTQNPRQAAWPIEP